MEHEKPVILKKALVIRDILKITGKEKNPGSLSLVARGAGIQLHTVSRMLGEKPVSMKSARLFSQWSGRDVRDYIQRAVMPMEVPDTGMDPFEYAGFHGFICPACMERTTAPEPLDNKSMTRRMSCMNCEAEWTEHLSVSHYSNLKKKKP